MDSLPDELILHILSYLDIDPPSVRHFADEPRTVTSELTHDHDTPLKFISATSRRLRRIATPLLFQYSRLHLNYKRKWIRLDEHLAAHCERNLEKLNDNERRLYLQLRQRHESRDVWEDTILQRMPLNDADHVLNSAPTAITYLGLSHENRLFLEFVINQELQQHVKSLVVYTDHDLEALEEGELSPTQQREHDWTRSIWRAIFQYLDPSRLVIAAPPNTVGGLVEIWTYAPDAWVFEMTTHYLELNRRNQKPQDEMKLKHAIGCCRHKSPWLLNLRPWNRLAYNEGSSLNAYSTYEHYSKETPLILPSILSRLAIDVGACCNLQSVSLVASFPISGNINNVSNELYMLASTLREIEIKLLPTDLVQQLNDKERMKRAQHSDLWLEWEESYSSILSALDFTEKDTRLISHDAAHREVVVDPGTWRIQYADETMTIYRKSTPRTQLPEAVEAF